MSASLNRRELLAYQPRSPRFAGDVLAARDEPGGTALLSVSRRAMACLFEIIFPAGSSRAVDAAHAALEKIDRLEAQLTVYGETSEVSRLNALAAYAPVAVDQELFQLLLLSARLSEKTEGAFDITTGALIKAWGFYRGPRRVPSEEEIAAARSRVGMRHVVLDETAQTVFYRQRGLEINLGSIGKGYALDRVAESLRQRWRVGSALLHGGYSSVYALGAPPHDVRGWTVGICDPRDPAYRVAQVRLKDRALGTSAVTFQHLEHEGRKLGHILDPRAGWPAEGMLSVSVTAPTAAVADALATAFFILGVEKARGYCQTHPEIGAVLIPEPKDGEAIRLLRIGRVDCEILPRPERLRQESMNDYD